MLESGTWEIWGWYGNVDLALDGASMSVNICKHSPNSALEYFTTCMLYLSKCIEFMLYVSGWFTTHYFPLSNSSENAEANSNVNHWSSAKLGRRWMQLKYWDKYGGFNFPVFIAEFYCESSKTVWLWRDPIFFFFACRTSNNTFIFDTTSHQIYSKREKIFLILSILKNFISTYPYISISYK